MKYRARSSRAGAAIANRWESLAPWVLTRAAVMTLFLTALAVYAIEALAWPLTPGRDYGSYVGYYATMWHLHPVLPEGMLWRTPLAPLVIGVPLDIGGGWLLEVVMALLFAGSIVAWALAARSFGPLPALATASILLLYPSYGALLHTACSDSIFVAGFAFWALGFVYALRARSMRAFALLGVGVALLALIRPANQALIAVAIVPLVLSAPWRRRLAWSAVVLMAAALPLAAFAGLNAYRSHDFAVARGGNAILLYREFVADKIVSPDNGPNSRELARAVERELLTKEPYRSYGITLDEFFSSGSIRMYQDLFTLSDRVWGWDSDQAKLRAVAIEAIRRHPGTYADGVVETIWQELTHPLYLNAPKRTTQTASAARPETILVNGRRLPKPTEGEPIPAARQMVSTRNGSVREVWSSATEHAVVFDNARDQRRFAQLHAETRRRVGLIPTRDGSASFALLLNRASHVFPPPALWLLVGAIAFAIRRPRGAFSVVGLVLVGLVVVIAEALGVPTVIEYLVPIAPAFVLLAAVGLFAPRDPAQPATALERPEDSSNGPLS